jgi:ubiquinol-cytochrome c reductase cytochrome b subunit
VPIRSNQRIGPHDYNVLCIIFGSMLGDGYANLRTQNYGNTVRFSFKQSFVHKDYLFYLYKFFLLRGYCSNLEPRIYKRRIKGYNKIYQGYEFMTYSFTSLV